MLQEAFPRTSRLLPFAATRMQSECWRGALQIPSLINVRADPVSTRSNMGTLSIHPRTDTEEWTVFIESLVGERYEGLFLLGQLR